MNSEGDGGCDVLEAWGPVDHGGGERAAADGGGGLQAELGCGPGRAVDQSGDTPTLGVLELEEAMDEGVQELIVVAEEDANSQDSGGAENAIDDIGWPEGGPHHIASIPVVEGVCRLAVAWVIRVPIGIIGAGAGVWRKLAAGESGEMVALLLRGFGDRSDVHVG